MRKIYKTNHIRVIAEFIISVLLLTGAAVLFWHFLKTDATIRPIIYGIAALFACVIGLLSGHFRCISKVEFDSNSLKITYLLFRTEIIDFSKIKDYKFFNKFKNIHFFYISNQKPKTIQLYYFARTDREMIISEISEIMQGFFLNYSEEQLDQFYDDKSQYNFSATEKHSPIFVFLALLFSVVTFFTLLSIVLLLIYPPNGGIFSVIEKWFLWFLLFSWILTFWLDTIIPKRTLICENGIITIMRKGQIIHTFNTENIIRYGLNYKVFVWVLRKTPKKEHSINLIGFSREEKKNFRNKLRLLLT